VLKAGRQFEPDALLTYMPHLAVEIQSPGQSDKFMADKAAYYLANGAGMMWVVYPTKCLVEVLTLTDRKLLTSVETLTGGDLLPGFTLSVSDIFPA
jgi:Uma2 family endonuclease